MSTQRSQQSIKQWVTHRFFIPNVSSIAELKTSFTPSNCHQIFTEHLKPFGTPLPIIDPSSHLHVCIQNTQHDFKLYNDGLEMATIIENLKNIDVVMFIPISPNVNGKNPTNWARTKNIFRKHFKQVHLSAVSSNIGEDPLCINKNLVGGSAILTFGLWASKVSSAPIDNSGFGTFSITPIQGKGGKHVSFISAYITVQKGSEIGTESLYAQQVMLHEKHEISRGSIP